MSLNQNISQETQTSTRAQEINSEAVKNEVPQNGSAAQNSKSSPTNLLSNGTTNSEAVKPAIRKPPPPVQAKPSRFLKTKSLTLSSIPNLGSKTSASKLNDGTEENAEGMPEPPVPQSSKGQQRESHRWKLRGISTLKRNRRHSAVEEVSLVSIDRPKSSTPPPGKRTATLTSMSTPHHPHERPALQAIPLCSPLPLNGTGEQNKIDLNNSTNTFGSANNIAMPAANNAVTMPEGIIEDPIDAKDCNSSKSSLDLNGVQAHGSLTHSCESVNQTDDPQSSSTPKSLHSSISNGQAEKPDTICSLIDKYSRYVPLRIRVLQGYCSDSADINISTRDLYDIQKMQTTKVVTVRDRDGLSCRIPIESTMKFGGRIQFE